MLDIKGQVRSLLRLQTLDGERHELRTELAATPKALDARRLELDGAIVRRDATGVEAKSKKKAIATDERALEGIERRRDRAKKRMPNLMTSTQIEATQREIATLTGEAGLLEEQILLGMEELEELQASLEEQRQAVQAGEAGLADQLATWAEREAELSARLAVLDAEREPAAGTLHSDVVRRYNLGWSQHWKPPAGVTTARNFICATCNGRVSPKWIQESRNHRALHACDYCKRLIIFDPDAAPEPPVQEPREQEQPEA